MPINILKLHLLLDYVYEKYTLIKKNLTYWFSHQFSVFVSLYFLGEKANEKLSIFSFNENCEFIWEKNHNGQILRLIAPNSLWCNMYCRFG